MISLNLAVLSQLQKLCKYLLNKSEMSCRKKESWKIQTGFTRKLVFTL